jgi:hypothetical protein
VTPEERQEIMRRLAAGEALSPECARLLFPPEKREYELLYHGKEHEEDILAVTLDRTTSAATYQTVVRRMKPPAPSVLVREHPERSTLEPWHI